MAQLLIVAATFYQDLTAELISGAEECVHSVGHHADVLRVPGAFEIPAAIRFALHKRDNPYDGFIALGCVIRGETSHYDYVCTESARGLNELALHYHAAIGYGILTVENEQQAWQRAARDKGNKGRDAAEACLRMIAIKAQFGVRA